MKQAKRLITWINLKRTKTVKFIYKVWNSIKGRYNILKTFVETTKYKDYVYWSNDNDEKVLSLIFIEWFFNKPMKYIFFGLLITLSLSLTGFIGAWLTYTVSVFAFYEVVRVIRKGE